MNSMTQQRREGEANGPHGQRPAGVSRGSPSWTEFVRPAQQAVVAFAGANMINCAERRASGRSRGPRHLAPELGTKEPQALCQTQPAGLRKGVGWQGRASNRNGENPPYGMKSGGGRNVRMTWRPFAMMLERANTTEVAGLTKKDSVERSAPRKLECKQDVTARSLNAIGRWTSPGDSLAFCFLSHLAATGCEE